MKKCKALIIGGSKGIGLGLAIELAQQAEKVTIVGRTKPIIKLPSNVDFLPIDLTATDFKWLDNLNDINFLFYSAGFGKVTHFENIKDNEIERIFQVNVISCFRVLNYFMNRITGHENFYCGVMSSIAGRIASPLFSMYSATKAALFRGIEAINCELRMKESPNRILEVSPGFIQGTSFTGEKTDISKIKLLANDIINSMLNKKEIFIPSYEEVYKKVIERYNEDPIKFATESYQYKIDNNRLQ